MFAASGLKENYVLCSIIINIKLEHIVVERKIFLSEIRFRQLVIRKTLTS